MQERFDVPGFVCEFNITGSLWTSRVTSHVPLREVADAHHRARRVHDAVHIIRPRAGSAGIAAPRIAVVGLNPHAGDGGSIGREEIEIIEPAVERRRRRASTRAARIPPDTVFVARAPRRLRRGGLDVPRPGPDRDEADGLRAAA